jgi:hypothetical protein
MLLRSKLAASGIHFLLSLAVFSVFVLVLLLRWFPEPYFTASGGIQGLKLVVLVDLVLGPTLTFVAFSPTKPRSELMRDLSFIALLQISALVWGIYAMHSQRPLAIVFWDNSFYTVPQQALGKHYADDPGYRDLVRHPRQLIFAEKPLTLEDHESLLKRVNELDLPPHHQLELYRPFADGFDFAKQAQVDIQEITSRNTDMAGQLDKLLQQTGQTIDALVFLPLKSRYRNIVLVFDNRGKTLGYIEAPLKDRPE